MEFNEHYTVLRSFLGMPLGGFTSPIVMPWRRSLDGSTPVLGLPLLALGTSYEKFPGNDYLVNSSTYRIRGKFAGANCFSDLTQVTWQQIAVRNNYPVNSLTDRIRGKCASAIFSRFNTSSMANCSVQQLPCQLLDRQDSW